MRRRQSIGIVVNDLESFVPTQTTWTIAERVARRGVGVLLFPAWRLGVDEAGRVVGPASPFDGSIPGPPQQVFPLEGLDLVLIRTNPGREARPGVTEHSLVLLASLQRAGVRVVNDPVGLWRASSKLYLTEFAAHLRPRTLVTREVSEVRRFIDSEAGPCVIKPITGTRGRDVFFVGGPDGANVPQIVDVVSRQGLVMVQSYAPDAAAGDIRVVLLDGAPLSVGGNICAVRRRPGAGDFRSNIHAGGSAERHDLTPAQLDVCCEVAAKLKQDGIALAGLDLIGPLMVEVNVFSTGGFQDAERFSGSDFTTALVDWLVDPP